MKVVHNQTMNQAIHCKPDIIRAIQTYPLESFTIQDIPPMTIPPKPATQTTRSTPEFTQVILSPFFLCSKCKSTFTSQVSPDNEGNPNISLRNTKHVTIREPMSVKPQPAYTPHYNPPIISNDCTPTPQNSPTHQQQYPKPQAPQLNNITQTQNPSYIEPEQHKPELHQMQPAQFSTIQPSPQHPITTTRTLEPSYQQETQNTDIDFNQLIPIQQTNPTVPYFHYNQYDCQNPNQTYNQQPQINTNDQTQHQTYQTQPLQQTVDNVQYQQYQQHLHHFNTSISYCNTTHQNTGYDQHNMPIPAL